MSATNCTNCVSTSHKALSRARGAWNYPDARTQARWGAAGLLMTALILIALAI